MMIRLGSAAIALLVCCAAASAEEPACRNHDTLALDKYIEMTAGKPDRLDSAFEQVPKGLTIAKTTRGYITTRAAPIRILPTDQSESLAELKPYFNFKALCRVENPAGQWWLVKPLKDGILVYIPEAATEPAALR